MNLDGCGIPGVSIVTTEFADAVDVQSKAMGFEPAVVYTPHPIQNRTAEELKKIADDVIERALKLLTAES
jgi:hypothetical protein